MIRPEALASDRPHGPWSCRGTDIWDVICAAATGDVAALRRTLARDPDLRRAEYGYTQPLHFAVREGHAEAVRVLLDAGADPDAVGARGDELVTLARDRGHEAVARMIEVARREGGPVSPASERHDHDIHIAAGADDVARVRVLLDGEPSLLHRAGRDGATPLHRAVAASAREVVALLLERGADPNRAEGAAAPRGVALHLAAAAGDRALVELLLAHGADPNAGNDSAGSATFAARTPEIRALLLAHGGTLDAYDLVWLGEDDEVVRRIAADPAAAAAGCGSLFAAACTLGKRELVLRLLAAGARVPPVVTGCRSYLMCEPELLQLLLEGGMDPDLPDWQQVTPLHELCARDRRGRPLPHREACARLLIDRGATISARDEEYRSTPLAWAARSDLPDMVDLLLAAGAPTGSPGDEPWATPLAWATRRGHDAIVERLRRAGAPS